MLIKKQGEWNNKAKVNLPDSISVTTDLSTSKAGYPYCAITVQVCTDNFDMYEELLSFDHFAAPHTGDRNLQHVTVKLRALKPEWIDKNFEQICYSATTDCGSNNNALATADSTLKVPCAGHRGNTVTSNLDAFEPWKRVCDTMDYFHKLLRKSTGNRQELERVMAIRIASLGAAGVRTKKDVLKQLSNLPRTRWAHTAKHFERYIELLQDIYAMDKNKMAFTGNKYAAMLLWEDMKRQAQIDKDIINIIYPLIEKMQFWMVRTQGSQEPTISLLAYFIEDMLATVQYQLSLIEELDPEVLADPTSSLNCAKEILYYFSTEFESKFTFFSTSHMIKCAKLLDPRVANLPGKPDFVPFTWLKEFYKKVMYI